MGLKGALNPLEENRDRISRIRKIAIISFELLPLNF
jgi:hypothetical protein